MSYEDRDQLLENKRKELYIGYRLSYIRNPKYLYGSQHPEYFERKDRISLPEIPLGVLSEGELAYAKGVCLRELQAHNSPDLFTKIAECMEFCSLLARPENHIKVTSGQYIDKPHFTRTVADMAGEMAQELLNLPRFTAYTKILKETGTSQTVEKKKITTTPLPPETKGRAFLAATWRGKAHGQGRDEIDEELRGRQAWREQAQGTTTPPQSPPTSPPPDEHEVPPDKPPPFFS